MSYSIEEISVINQQGLAEEGVYYHTIEGDTYKGTSDGRLIYVDPDFVELQDSVQTLETTVQEITASVDEIVTEPEPEPITSYFEIDAAFNFLVPVDPISNVIVGNIFSLDTDIGALVPQEYDPSNADEFYEYEGAGTYIIPKVA